MEVPDLKRWILAGALGLALCAAFFGMLILSVFSAILSATESSDAASIDAPIPCTITGKRTGDDLKLTLEYDGMKVTGITGTVSGDGSFTASTKTSGEGKTKMELPSSGADLDVQTFMCYTAVTAEGSAQYKLLNSSGAKDVGIYRKVNGRYAVALGSFYGSEMGTCYLIEFRQPDGSTKRIPAILGDQKADQHTDAKHQYHTVDKSVVEFITAAGTYKTISATQKQINKDFGVLTAIYRVGGTEVELNGTIDGNQVRVGGTVDGSPLTASGTIQNGKLQASGFIGEESAESENGIYTGGKFLWPVPKYSYISCDFGQRICPFHGREVHSGVDLAAPYGVSVLAAADGKVVLSGWNGSYGNCVILSHGSGLFTLYGHNSSLQVKVGDTVKRGDVIALVGSTGASTGNHSHFEVREGGNEHGNAVSPWKYLKKPN